MCTKETNTVFWAHYLNSQLGIHWENALKCSDTSPNCVYSRALASYDYDLSTGGAEGREGPRGNVRFRKPQLLFLCNHVAMLYFTTDNSGGNPDANAGANGLQLEGGVEAAFRVSFSRTHVTGRDSKIDDQAQTHEVRMVVFDFENATLVSTYENNSDDLTKLFKSYLKFLRSAGYHVLFGLPNFADKKSLDGVGLDYAILPKVINHEQGPINISLENIESYYTEITYHGIKLEQINTFLRDTQYKLAEVRIHQKYDLGAASIKNVDWTYDSKSYKVSFGEPKVKPLCHHEVFFILKVTEVKENGADVAVIENWEVFFIVRLVPYDGKTLRVNFSDAHFYSFFSTTSDLITTSNTVESSFIEYLKKQYLEILTKYSYNMIYALEEARGPLLPDAGFWRRVHGVTDFVAVRGYSESEIWNDRSQFVSMNGIDQAFALTERSIGHLVRTRWRATNPKEPLEYHSEDGGFDVTFSSFRVLLLSNNKIILFVDIEEAKLRPQSQSQSQSTTTRLPPDEIFNNGEDLSISSGSSESANTTTTPTRVFKGHLAFEVAIHVYSLAAENLVYDLGLDLSGAHYVESSSSLWDIGLHEDVDEGTMTIVRGHLERWFETLPVSTAHGEGKPRAVVANIQRQKATDFSLTVMSEREITIETTHSDHIDASDSSLLLIYGVSEGKLPDIDFRWSSGWLPSGEKNGLGTVWLSRTSFIQPILDVLVDFNAETTLVRDRDDSENFITLKDRRFERESKRWQLDSKLSNARYMAYSWYYHLDATRREHGTHVRHQFDSLILRTESHVWVPLHSISSGSQIIFALTGEHEIRSSRRGSVSKSTIVKWSLLITLSSSHEGLKVSIERKKDIDVPQTDGRADIPYDPKARIIDRLDTLVEIAQSEMNNRIGDASVANWFGLDESYTFANPIFTRAGDFVLEVYRASQDATSDSTDVQTGNGNTPGPNGGAPRETSQQPASMFQQQAAVAASQERISIQRQSSSFTSSSQQSSIQQSSTQQGFSTGSRAVSEAQSASTGVTRTTLQQGSNAGSRPGRS